jgi:peptidoglycan/xylan/chitin deacetylase (PgdA/CDA1 family)
MVALMYHDVVEPGKADASGFPGPVPARYKLTSALFRQHLETLAWVMPRPAGTVADLLANPAASPVLFTFDDGGCSAACPVADWLEELGWRGHFLVTTNYIDTPGFLSTEQIRHLRRRGHVIGTHSCSHPRRMASCSWEQLVWEWSQSCAVLAGILDEPITVGSVPGGFYSRRVAEAAAAAGLRVLFNSEPTRHCYPVNSCLIVGRYTLYAGMSAAEAAGLVAGPPWQRWRQTVLWQIKKIAKAVGGRGYLALQDHLLARRSSCRTDF